MQLRFISSEARAAFMAMLKLEDPHLFGHIKPLYSQPTVAVVDDIESTARVRLKSMLAKTWGSCVTVYHDTQFQTFVS